MSKTLPIVPMRSGVLFPGVSLPITAARPGTLRAIEAALRDPEHRVFVVAQRDDVDEVTADGLYTFGVVATLGSVQRGMAASASSSKVTSAASRCASRRMTATSRPPSRDAVELQPLDPKDPTFVALHREVRDRAGELAKKRGVPEETVEQMLAHITEPGRLVDLVAGYLDIPVADRQALLETLAIEDRLRRVLIHVQRQIEVLSAQEDIQSKVKEELGDRQREVYLRQQLKAIQNELGEGDEASDEALKELKTSSTRCRCPTRRARKSRASGRA